MKQYEVILFDVDGTLLDFNLAERLGIREVMKTYGVVPTEELEACYHEINQSLWKAYETGEITKEQIVETRFAAFFDRLAMKVDGREAERLYRGQLDQSSFLLEGALEICEYLSSKYKMYIVTNGVSQTQYKRLAASGLDHFFQGIFVSEDAGSQKPQKAFFDYCFSKMQEFDPSKMLLIGDSLSSDIKGGNGVGIDTCWYNPKNSARSADIFVTYQIQELAELKEML